ncbi:MAG: YjbQ family protein, partial [Balneolaceae bacterium]|nr:YjbQ family protein [Balneolaceae bacterium]
MFYQKKITLSPRPRGYHIITDDIVSEVPEIAEIDAGLAHIFIKHTSASLTINENADPSVRKDFKSHFKR